MINFNALPKLDSEEQLHLLREYRQNKSLKLRNFLMERNLKLVKKISCSFQQKNNQLDLFQEGCFGLIESLEKFDPSLGYQFSTYATWWIRSYIQRALRKQSRFYRDHISEWQSNSQGEECNLMEFKDLHKTLSPIEDFENFELYSKFRKRLSDKECQILDQRFYHFKTLKEVGEKFGYTKERIRQIEVRTLQRLRKFYNEETT